MPSDDEPGRLRRFHERFIVETREVTATGRTTLYVVAGALMVVGLAAFLVILDAVNESDDLTAIDEPVRAWFESIQSPPLTVFMAIVATVFGPLAMPIVVLVTTVWWGLAAKHAWRPLLLAGGMIVGVATVQILAPIIGRDATMATMPAGALIRSAVSEVVDCDELALEPEAKTPAVKASTM